MNFAGLLMIDVNYQDMPPFPLVPGLEVAGVVDAVGRDAAGVAKGARVAAQCGRGGFAEYVVADATRILPLPDAMDDHAGADFQIAYGTSHLALARRGPACRGKDRGFRRTDRQRRDAGFAQRAQACRPARRDLLCSGRATSRGRAQVAAA